MKRSLPLAQLSVFGRQFSVPGGGESLTTSHTSPVTRPSARPGAFTLIELMVVVAVVAILAGLTLGGMGYVNRKSAASRAQTEVAALSAAIESYKLDFGAYPSNNATTLYRELTGQGTVNTNKVYIEPTPGMVTNTASGPFIDPYGVAYNYSTNAPNMRNVGFFDLYCVPPDAKSEADWIHN